MLLGPWGDARCDSPCWHKAAKSVKPLSVTVLMFFEFALCHRKNNILCSNIVFTDVVLSFTWKMHFTSYIFKDGPSELFILCLMFRPDGECLQCCFYFLTSLPQVEWQ